MIDKTVLNDDTGAGGGAGATMGVTGDGDIELAQLVMRRLDQQDQAIAQIRTEIVDLRAQVTERGHTLDTLLASLESSANGVALTAGRLRDVLDR
jgi:hypothetical protein